MTRPSAASRRSKAPFQDARHNTQGGGALHFLSFSLPALVFALAASAAPAANPGDEVVVVYNSALPESKAIAEHYAQMRHVPGDQIFGFDMPLTEDTSRADFRTRLQKPLAKVLSDKKLWQISARMISPTNDQPRRIEWRVSTSKIRYAVLCYGTPLRILPDPNLKEEGAEKLRPEMRHDEAAVDSELALLPFIEEGLRLNGPLPNPLYGVTNSAALHPTNCVLLVTRLDGPSPDIARNLVDKALQAETNGLWGRAYFDLWNTSEPGLKVGDDWIRHAAEIARHLGFETIVDENSYLFPTAFPLSHVAYYAGWYATDVAGAFARPTVEFMPGAFAYHLHSFSAPSLHTAHQHWAGPLLAKGAAATMGCVFEPYLGGTPEIAIFTARFLYNGFTFGEAAYACQPVLSWQTTVVGDPLYRPTARNPGQLHEELQAASSPWLEWSYLRLINLNLANGKSASDLIHLLESLELTPKSAVLSEKLGDLYAAIGKPSSAVHAFNQALKLNPSPQQRVRLLLTLGERLTALENWSEAYAAYQTLLEPESDYPDKLGLYQKLLPLTSKVNKPQDGEKYQAEIIRLTAPPPPPPTNTAPSPK